MGFADATHSIPFVIANSMINFLATFPGMYFIERLGRRKLLIYGGIAMTISHLMVCVFTGLSKGSAVFAWCAVASVCKPTAFINH
jgi:MFS family permease